MGTMVERLQDPDFGSLITLHNNQDKQVVSARELYILLGYDLSNYTRWCKKNILENQFCIEGEDWWYFKTHYTSNNPKPTQDFLITIHLAQRLAVRSQKEIGHQLYNYFDQLWKNVQNLHAHQHYVSALRRLADKEEAKLKAFGKSE